MKILILEDDFTLAKELQSFLQGQGYDCECLYDGQLFLRKANTESAGLFILDINVPGLNGMEVCAEIRRNNKVTPILMLTAFGEIEEKVASFRNGADDYLVKPFHFDELLYRVKALLRRGEKPVQTEENMNISNLVINEGQGTVSREGQDIHLTPKEFKLLVILARARGRVVSKQQIAEQLWDDNVYTSLNTLEVFINFLRKKIDRDFEPKLIHTKQGFGYYLKEESE